MTGVEDMIVIGRIETEGMIEGTTIGEDRLVFPGEIYVQKLNLGVTEGHQDLWGEVDLVLGVETDYEEHLHLILEADHLGALDH